jgi:hypothetical protein
MTEASLAVKLSGHRLLKGLKDLLIAGGEGVAHRARSRSWA